MVALEVTVKRFGGIDVKWVLRPEIRKNLLTTKGLTQINSLLMQETFSIWVKTTKFLRSRRGDKSQLFDTITGTNVDEFAESAQERTIYFVIAVITSRVSYYINNDLWIHVVCSLLSGEGDCRFSMNINC